MKPKQQHHGNPIPIRLSMEQQQLIGDYQAKTGLAKSFVIRRCISYALEKFASGEIDILTLQEKQD